MRSPRDPESSWCRRAAITTVIGPNGAGKSTMFKTIFGLLPTRSGTVTFDGHPVTNFTPRQMLNAGVAYIPQGRNIFPELSVRHNLELGGIMLGDQAKLPARLEQIWSESANTGRDPAAVADAMAQRLIGRG